MILTGLAENNYAEIWNAPEGNDYAVQFRRQGEKEWYFSDFALSKKTAMNWFAYQTKDSPTTTEYRVVKLSRYPPCPVVQIISYRGAQK